jgi:mevalonate kinase
MGVGTARAKLLLFGEHAAVHGHPAVGMTLPWTLTVTHTPGPDWDVGAWGPYAEPVRRLVDRLAVLAGERGLPPPVPGRLDAVSDIVPAGGFGSSAALCAALVDVFFPGLDAAARDELAWRAEFLFHGTPSGIDTALAFREGCWALEPGTPGQSPARPRPLPHPRWALVVGSVARDADTKTLVASVSQRLKAGDPSAQNAIASLGDLARRAAIAIEAGGDARPLVGRAREGLRSLGLETPALTSAIDAGLERAGAIAGKLSGAGGGGAFFVVFADADSAREAVLPIRRALPEALWRAPPVSIVP